MWDRVPRKGILTPTQGSPLGRDRRKDCHHAGGHREGPHEPNILRRERGCEPLRAFAGGRGRGWVGPGLSGASRASEGPPRFAALPPDDVLRGSYCIYNTFKEKASIKHNEIEKSRGRFIRWYYVEQRSRLRRK